MTTLTEGEAMPSLIDLGAGAGQDRTIPGISIDVSECRGTLSTMIRSALMVVVAAAFLLAASVVFIAGASRCFAARASKSWTETEGAIIESRLDSNCTHCWPIINYRYMVNGRGFVGDHIVAGPQDYYNRGEADAKARLYAIGSKLAVYYDPKDPAVSCLEPGVLRRFAYMYLALAGCLLSMGLFYLWPLYRSKSRVGASRGFEPRTNRL